MRSLFTLLIVIVCNATIFSQTLPSFEKKILKDPDGNIFWPLSMPVNMQLTWPDSKEVISLTNVKDASMKAFANPMKWDGHGIHYIKHSENTNSAVPEREISFPVYVDGISPVTTFTLKGSPYLASGKVYFGKDLSGSLKATDEMSGVASTHISTNSADYILNQSEISFSEENEYVIKYLSADRVGNSEEPKSKGFIVDTSSPLTAHQTNIDHLDDKILSPRTVITLSATDKLSGVKKTEFFLDSNNPVAGLKVTLGNANDGEHVLNFSSLDHVGNKEVVNQHPFYLDAIAPVVSSSFEGNIFKSKGRVYIAKATTIQFTASDNKAGVKEIAYSINDAAAKLYETPFKLPQKQGSFTVKFKGTDLVNNKGPMATNDDMDDIFLDDTAPSISHLVGLPKVFTRDTLFITKESSITLKSIDLESGSANIDYKIDAGASTLFEQPFLVANEGKHSVGYTGYDNVKNSASKEFLFIVDNTPPEIFWHTSLSSIATENGHPVFASGTSFYLAATDKVVGTKAIYYTLNKAAEVISAQPLRITAKGNYTLKIRAVDYLNNQIISDDITFVVK